MTLLFLFAGSLHSEVLDLLCAGKKLLEAGLFKGFIWANNNQGLISERLLAMNRVDKKFTSLGYEQVLRGELFPISANVQSIEFSSMDNPHFVQLVPFLLLHKSGGFVFSAQLEVGCREAVSVQDAIRLSSIGLFYNKYEFREGTGVQPEPEPLRSFINEDRIVRFSETLHDVKQGSIHPLVQWTVAAIRETDPKCKDLDRFVAEYARELSSIANMDIWGYDTRSERAIAMNVEQDLSIDAEFGVFLGPRSMLVVCKPDETHHSLEQTCQEYGWKDLSNAFVDFLQHYAVFLEWAMIEISSIKGYLLLYTSFAENQRTDVNRIIQAKGRMVQHLQHFHDRITEFTYGQALLNAIRRQEGTSELLEKLTDRRTIVEEIALVRANMRIQTGLLILTALLVIGLALEISELWIKVAHIQEGACQWMMIKLAAIALPVIVFVWALRARPFR